MKYSEVKDRARKLRNFQTESEKMLWKELKDRKLDGYKFLRQHPILYDRQGNDLNFFIPDFYCPRARLIIEVDGKVHDRTKDYDHWRTEILRHKGLRVIRFRNEDLKNLEVVLDVIRETLKSTHPPAPSQLAERGCGGG